MTRRPPADLFATSVDTAPVSAKFIPALLSATLLAGCTVGPNFHAPAPPTAARYTASADPKPMIAGGPRITPGAAPDAAWWRAFGSPELDRLVDLALANNRSLAASDATLERSRDLLRAAAGQKLPQIDANGRFDREQINLAGFGFAGSGNNQLFGGANPLFNLYSVGGGVSYDLDLFGGVRRQIEQVAAQAESQRRQTEAAHLAIAGRVVNQVLAIARIRAQIATAGAILADDRRDVALTQARRAGGEGTLVEVLDAQSQFAGDQGRVAPLEQQLAEARHMLAILVGVTPADLGATEIDLDTLTLPAEVPVALPSELVHRRPDILQAEADLHAATAAIGAAQARLYPNIVLAGTIEQGAPGIDDLLKNAFRGYDLFAALSAPIFHGGTLKGQRDAAVAAARAADARYQQTVLEALGQVADLLSAIVTDQRTLANQRAAADVAGRAAALSRRSFQVGNSGILQVLDTERLYQQARAGLVDARAAQFLNVARLSIATAGGWTGPLPAPGSGPAIPPAPPPTRERPAARPPTDPPGAG